MFNILKNFFCGTGRTRTCDRYTLKGSKMYLTFDDNYKSPK